MATVPIFAPDGSLGDIPAANLAAAVKAGAKPGVHITSPDGSAGVIPADRTTDAVKAGAKIVPIQDQPVKHEGFWNALGSDLKGIAEGTGKTILAAGTGNPAAFTDQALQTGATVSDNMQHRRDEGRSLAYRTIAPVGDALGVNTRGMEDAADAGDIGGVAGHAAAVPTAMAATAAIAHGAPPAAEVLSDAAQKSVREAVKTINKGLQKAPEAMGAAAGAGVGGAAGGVIAGPLGAKLGAEIGGSAGYAIGKSVLPKVQIPGSGFGLPDRVTGGPVDAPPYQPAPDPSLTSPARTLPGDVAPESTQPIPGVDVRPSLHRIMPDRGLQLTGEVQPVYPGGSLPATPPAELLQARSLAEGAKTPPPAQAKALGDLPVHAVTQAVQELGTKAPLADVTARANQIARLSELLNDSMGGKGLEPNVPLKNQGGAPTPQGVVEGHTPVQSSALKSYKYDPDAQEFESVTNTGAHYIHGDVSPDQAAAFEAASSKGKAWNTLRQNSTLVAKVVNGKRIPVKPVIAPEDSIPADEWEAGHALESQQEGSPR